ncbi:hypothetical protein BGW80DRAFT_1400495, partial [Lactifluus volemus]
MALNLMTSPPSHGSSLLVVSILLAPTPGAHLMSPEILKVNQHPRAMNCPLVLCVCLPSPLDNHDSDVRPMQGPQKRILFSRKFLTASPMMSLGTLSGSDDPSYVSLSSFDKRSMNRQRYAIPPWLQSPSLRKSSAKLCQSDVA